MKLAQGLSLALTFCSALYADNVLHPGSPRFDRPTLTALGVQLPITGDDNYNATVSVQYRVSGSSAWQSALPLFRVHPETVAGYSVAPHFGGSIFDLRPATTYDIQLQATDPDGGSQTFTISGTTRPIPGDPASPRVRPVTDSSSLRNALNSAVAGDVITLANGVYAGQFSISRAGTAANPIVIRGASEEGVILDGGNCSPCNILEVYGGGYIHLERLSMRNAERAIRFQQDGSSGNVVRYVHIKNTAYGIGGRSNQNDAYIADNILEGQLGWPHVYSDDNGANSWREGIAVFGSGIVVAYNRISGYGDAIKTEQTGARANDFYGNEVLYSYDNGVELDDSEGNVRCFRNRFTNVFSPLSVQPIHGGPAYIFRNVAVNVAEEQLKFHSLNTSPPQEPSGVLVYNNTFVSPPNFALTMQTPAYSHYFEIQNNLFISPPTSGPETADWTGGIDHGTFDYNGYYPDGIFRFNNPALGGYFLQRSFAGLQSLGMERHGILATGVLFSSGLAAPSTSRNLLPPADVSLAAGSSPVDKGLLLPNINDKFQGSGPDLGALEQGCPLPSYGPRPDGVDETNQVVGCGSAAAAPPASVSLAPSSVLLGPSQTQQFSATAVPANSPISWSISPTRGTISASGLYTAPADARLGETITVKAINATNASASATAIVNLTAPVSVSITPGSVTLAGSQTQQFTAVVSGAVNTAVSWILSPAAGSITVGGLFTAPAATTATQSINVTAVSAANFTKTASAAVTISAVAPAPAPVAPAPAPVAPAPAPVAPAPVPAAPAVGSGLLQGIGSAQNSISLTSEGTVDWAHWGDDNGTNRKAIGTSILGDITPTGSAFYRYNNDLRTASWTDGKAIGSSSGNRYGLFIERTGSGFSFTVPATTSTQVLRIHVGGWRSSGQMVATLSDGSAAQYTDSVAYTDGQYLRDYEFSYRAVSAGQSITVKWTMAGGPSNGNVTWNAASLSTPASPAGTGLLQGAGSVQNSISLTSEGTVDWAHWGDDNGTNRKAIGTSILGDMTPTGPAFYRYNNDLRTVSWTDGKVVGSSSGNRYGLFIERTGSGFSFTVPATTSSQVLRIHVGGWRSSGQLVATLSDGSAAPYIESVSYTDGQYLRDYVLTYRAAAAGQSMTVKWTMTSGPANGNVTWNAVSLGNN